MRLSIRLLKDQARKFKLVVAGAGSGGNAMAQYFSRTIAISEIGVIDPNPKFYYQPGFPLLAGGIMDEKEVVRDRKEFHPDLVEWYKKGVKKFDPKNNKVILSDGTEVEYEFLVVSTGTQPRFDKIEGLPDAFNSPGVCSIYDYKLAQKTRDELQKFSGGTAVFTHPLSSINCAGANQKIMYLADDIFRENNVRDSSGIIYNSAMEKIFDIDRYKESLDKIMDDKHIVVHTRQNLKKVDASSKIAYFDVLDKDGKSTGETKQVQYEFLHVGPPCLPVEACLESAKAKNGLTDSEGWIDVDEKTLQSKKFKNVFALGDCVNTKNAKTAAAVSAQFGVVRHNVESLMNGDEMKYKYDGYSSYPFLVDKKHGLLAEFDYNDEQKETLPIRQDKPRFMFYYLDRYLLPFIYWNGLLRGFWQGPETIRKVMHLGMSK